MSYGIEKSPSVCLDEIKVQTLRERFEAKKKWLELQLGDINNALALLERNPGFEELHNAITRVGY